MNLDKQIEEQIRDMEKEDTGEPWEIEARRVLRRKMLYFPAKPILDDLIDGLRPIIKSLIFQAVLEAIGENEEVWDGKDIKEFITEESIRRFFRNQLRAELREKIKEKK